MELPGFPSGVIHINLRNSSGTTTENLTFEKRYLMTPRKKKTGTTKQRMKFCKLDIRTSTTVPTLRK